MTRNAITVTSHMDHTPKAPPRQRSKAAIRRDLIRVMEHELRLQRELLDVEDRDRTVGEEEVYTSLDLPREIKSRKTFAKLAAKCQGARKEGNVWIVSRTAWREMRFAKRSSPTPVADIDDDTATDAMIASAGLRQTRRAS